MACGRASPRRGGARTEASAQPQHCSSGRSGKPRGARRAGQPAPRPPAPTSWLKVYPHPSGIASLASKAAQRRPGQPDHTLLLGPRRAPSVMAAAVTFESGHADMVHDAQFDYYGRRLATCSSDRTIKVFELSGEHRQQIADLRGHEGPVWQVSWAHPRYGSLLASCSFDHRVIVWKEGPDGQWVQVRVGGGPRDWPPAIGAPWRRQRAAAGPGQRCGTPSLQRRRRARSALEPRGCHTPQQPRPAAPCAPTLPLQPDLQDAELAAHGVDQQRRVGAAGAGPPVCDGGVGRQHRHRGAHRGRQLAHDHGARLTRVSFVQLQTLPAAAAGLLLLLGCSSTCSAWHCAAVSHVWHSAFAGLGQLSIAATAGDTKINPRPLAPSPPRSPTRTRSAAPLCRGRPRCRPAASRPRSRPPPP